MPGTAYASTVELDEYRVLLDNEPVSFHPTLDFSTEEQGNLVALVEIEERPCHTDYFYAHFC